MVRIILSAARINAGYNQREVADLMGVSRATVQNWEQYKTSPSVEQAEQLSDIYQLPLENIIFSRKN